MTQNDVRKRRIALLEKYFPVDKKKKIITFKLYYDKASDLLDYSVGEVGKETFKDTFLNKIYSLFEKVPVDYKANVILEISDYDVYNEEIIMEKFNDYLEMATYDARHNSKKNGFASTILFIVGFIILTVDAILSTYSILGNGTILSNVLNESLNITSWVFIWQAVSQLFLPAENDNKYLILIFHKLNTFSVATKGVIKVTRTNEQLSSTCMVDSSFSNAQKQILVVSSSLLFYEGVVMIIISIINLIHDTSFMVVKTSLIDSAFAIIIASSSIFSLTRFTNNYVGNRRFIIFFAFAFLAAIAYLIYELIIVADFFTLMNIIFIMVLLVIASILCVFWNTLGFRNPKRENLDDFTK